MVSADVPRSERALDRRQPAAPALDAFLDAELQRRSLPSALALVGFSQGTMMALHVGLRRAVAPAAIVGYSGMLVVPENVDPDTFAAEIRSKPPVLLIHGDADELIPVQAIFHAAQGLAALEVPVEWHISPGIGHGIDQEGLRHGAEFWRNSLPRPFRSSPAAALDHAQGLGNARHLLPQSRHAALLVGRQLRGGSVPEEVEERRLNVHVSASGFPALVLNADFRPLSYYPLSLWSWQDAIKAVFLERVNIVANYDRAVHSPSLEMKLPSVVSLKTYVKPSTHPAFTRFNVFLRDRFSCQYCGDRDDLTFDHLLPRSRGGHTTWDNVVAACSPCNLRKGSLTPSESRMWPSQMPFQPTVHHLHRNGRLFPPNYLHESWLDYLYWDTELEP